MKKAINGYLYSLITCNAAAHYKSGIRKYHTHSHVQAMEYYFKHVIKKPITLEIALALQYHDAVMVNNTKGNSEGESAILMLHDVFNKIEPSIVFEQITKLSEQECYQICRDAELNFNEPEPVVMAYNFILATRNHLNRPKNLPAEGHQLLDADLFTLASSEDKYSEYANAIREEYFFIGNSEFARARINFLKKLLAGNIFSEHAPDGAEIAAKRNIRAEIDKLSEVLWTESTRS